MCLEECVAKGLNGSNIRLWGARPNSHADVRLHQINTSSLDDAPLLDQLIESWPCQDDEVCRFSAFEPRSDGIGSISDRRAKGSDNFVLRGMFELRNQFVKHLC